MEMGGKAFPSLLSCERPPACSSENAKMVRILHHVCFGSSQQYSIFSVKIGIACPWRYSKCAKLTPPDSLLCLGLMPLPTVGVGSGIGKSFDCSTQFY